MKRLPITFLLAASAFAQTTIYLPSTGGPPAAQITGVSNSGAPAIITTATAHLLASGDTIYVGGVCEVVTGTGTVVNGINGLGKVAASPAPTTYTFALNTLGGSGVAPSGAWCSGAAYSNAPGVQWVKKVAPFTLGSQPLGNFDGPTGDLSRTISLGPTNGMATSAGLVVSGCPSACLITVATTFDPTGMKIPVAAGQNFAVYGTHTGLDTCGDGSGSTNLPGAPYTAAAATSSGWTSNTFTCSGLSNSDYTNAVTTCGPASTPNDTIGGSQSCTTVSFKNQLNNPAFIGEINDACRQQVSMSMSVGICIPTYSDGYKLVGDGNGQVGADFDRAGFYAVAAEMFWADRSNARLFAIVQYAYQHPWLARWIVNELLPAGGDQTYIQQGNYGGTGEFAFMQAVYAPYASSASKTTFLNLMYNDLPDGCSKNGVEVSAGTPGVNRVVNSGTVGSTTNDTTHITLASSASATTNYYVGAIVVYDPATSADMPTIGCWGRVTAYNGTTKVATVNAAWQGNTSTGAGCSQPTAGYLYGVYASVIWSSVTALGSATVTGTLTQFTTDAAVGSTLLGVTGWYVGGSSTVVTTVGCTVTAIADNTHLTCANGAGMGGSLTGIWGPNTTDPVIEWSLPAMTNSSCGMFWALNHWNNVPGSQPVSYPPEGGDLVAELGIPLIGSNNAQFAVTNHAAMDIAAAPDDSRAITDLAKLTSYAADPIVGHMMGYSTGYAHSGASYSPGVLGTLTAYVITMSKVPGYPSLFPTTPYLSAFSQYKMYTALPEVQNWASIGNDIWPARWGAEDGFDFIDTSAGGYASDANLFFAPTSTLSTQFKNWANHIMHFDLLGRYAAGFTASADFLLAVDPRIGSLNYNTLPLQYAFTTTSAANCAAFLGTGSLCNNGNFGGAVVSRTGWGNYDGSSLVRGGLSSSFLQFSGRGFADDHDNPEAGQLRLYKVGQVLDTDGSPAGNQTQVSDMSILGDTFQFGGDQGYWGTEFLTATYNVPNQFGTPYINRWASVGNGSYGDASSRYVYTCAETAGQFQPSWNVLSAMRCIAHFKKSGNDEFIFQWDTASTSGSTTGGIKTNVHYAQNGQNQGIAGGYTSGTTTCNGACSSLNTARATLSTPAIVSLEDGHAADDNPARIFGVVSAFLSPSTNFVHWDCPGGGSAPQCSPGSTYSGGAGYTDRVSICADPSSTGACGATASGFESLVVHKVVNGSGSTGAPSTDTTLTTTALNPDANWTGAQSCGAVGCGVFIGARGGITHSTMAAFTTTHSGTAQYLIGGLTPGTYTVTVGGSAISACNGVAGGTCTVGVNDTSAYFESTAGTVSVNGSAAPCSITTTSLPSGTVGAGYSQTIATANCTAPLTWSLAAGSMCAGLTLGASTGTIGGTPTGPGTCSFTAQALDSTPSTATQALSITIAAGAASGASSISTTTKISAGTIRH